MSPHLRSPRFHPNTRSATAASSSRPLRLSTSSRVTFTTPPRRQRLTLPPQALDFVKHRQHRGRVECGDVPDVSIKFPAGRIGVVSPECWGDASNKAVAIFCANLPTIDPPRPRRRRLGDAAQLLQALRCQISHHASPPTPWLEPREAIPPQTLLRPNS